MVVRVPMSKTGHARLREELTRLERHDRIDVIKAIEVARGHGDLKENAEYHAAKDRQGHIEGRIIELKDKLGRAEIIDCTEVTGDKIVFGATVELFDIGEDKDVTYKIVGELEADIKQNLISITSPIARALISKSVDDEVVVKAPGGDREYEIVSVTYK